MKVFGLQGGLYRLARLGWRQKIHDDPDVQLRLHALGQFRELHEKHGLSVRAAARIVGVPLSTLYEWRNRLRTRGLGGLRPRCTPRKKQWEPELKWRLLELRRRYPGWGKRKLAVLLRREGFEVSESTVGRMLSAWLRRGRTVPHANADRIKPSSTVGQHLDVAALQEPRIRRHQLEAVNLGAGGNEAVGRILMLQRDAAAGLRHLEVQRGFRDRHHPHGRPQPARRVRLKRHAPALSQDQGLPQADGRQP